MPENNRNIAVFLALLALVVMGIWASAFTIREGRQVIITQFGKPIRTVKEAGLHWKLPLIQDVREIDLRILNWDGYPNQIPTRDKKYIRVDTTARWRIVDPLKFIQTVQNEVGAKSRLDAVLDATTRDIVSGHNLVEAVRNSNSIFDVINERKQKAAESTSAEAPHLGDEGDEITGEVERIEIGREQLSALIVGRASGALEPFGIELIDVQLRSIMYEESVQVKVYQRMISERQRVAEKIRSIGKGEQKRIEGKVSEELQLIESDAYRQTQEIIGAAEAEAIRIYAQSFEADPKFYAFLRTLDVYKTGLGNHSQMILSPDLPVFDVLRSGAHAQ
jgi:membrane protease subunit HflC